MNNKVKLNKIVKYLGNFLMLLAIAIIIRKISSYNLNYSILADKSKIIFYIITIFIYSFTVILGGIPWAKIVQLKTMCDMHYSEVMYIYVKSNIYKYIPGNILQYAGRNELAEKKNLKHSDVAFSTLVDVIWYVFTIFVVSLTLAGNKLIMWIQMKKQIFPKTIIVFLCTIGVGLIFFYILYDKSFYKIKNFIKPIINLEFAKILIFNSGFYIIMSLLNAGIYVVTFSLLSDKTYSINEIFVFLGVMLVAFVIGFITPGSPGGVGIREAVSLFLLHDMINESVILSSILLVRMLSIIGDFISFILVWLFYTIKKIHSQYTI